MKIVVFFIISFLFVSCAPRISSQISSPKTPLLENQNVVVFEVNEEVPKNTSFIGNISLGDSGFTTNCDFETIINIAKSEARKVGGNALKITEHILPSFFGSSCHRIKADILEISEVNTANFDNTIINDTLNKIQPNQINNKILTDNTKLTRFVLISSVGYAYSLGKLPDGINALEKDYLNNLRSGYDFDLALYYRFKSKSNYAWGLKYNRFQTSNELNNLIFTNSFSGAKIGGKLSDNITVSFYAVSYVFDLQSPKSKHQLHSETSLGLVNYKNEKILITDNYLLTGSSFGINFGIGYKYRIATNFSVGPNINYFSSTLFQIKSVSSEGVVIDNILNKDSAESLSRLGINLNAVYRF